MDRKEERKQTGRMEREEQEETGAGRMTEEGGRKKRMRERGEEE